VGQFFDGVQHAAQNDDRSTIEVLDNDHEECVPITRFMSKGLNVNGSNLALVWKQPSKAFVVCADGKPVRSPLNGEPVMLNGSAAGKWHGNKESLQVVLKGVADPMMSTGTIVLEFASQEALSMCHNGLSQYGSNYVFESMDRLGNIFERASNELMKWDKRAQQTASRTNRVDGPANPPSARSHRHETLDEIRYEDGSQPTKLRPGMRDNTSPEVLVGDGHERSTRHKVVPDKSPRHIPEQTRKSERRSRIAESGSSGRAPEIEKWTQKNPITPWARPVEYPVGGPRRVTVDFVDLERLDDGEFLNDNVINYALREIEENMDPKHRDQVHFFNTFFYTTLTTKNGKKIFNYDAVKRWTKSVELLDKRYIVVPINLDYHWFVAIICNVNKLSRKCDAFDDEVGSESTDSESAASNAPVKQMDDLSFDNDRQERDVYIFDEDQVIREDHMSTKSNGNKSKKRKGMKYDPENDLVIMSLDSFGLPRSAQLKFLKLYVSAEAKERREISIDPVEIQGMAAKGIAAQSNLYDCGVYLLGYVKAFSKDPEKFVSRIMTRETDDDDFSKLEPLQIRAEIREKLLTLEKQQDAARREEKRLKSAAKKQTQQAAADTGVAMVPPASSPTPDQQTQKKSRPPGSISAKTAARLRSKPRPSPQVVVPRNETSLKKKRSPAGATNAQGESDELEVEAPRPLGRSERPSSSSSTDNEEMLDQVTEMELAEQQRLRPSDVASRSLLSPLQDQVDHKFRHLDEPRGSVADASRWNEEELDEIPDSQPESTTRSSRVGRVEQRY
jgi:hypothetical protein